jgi:hypothetical protein
MKFSIIIFLFVLNILIFPQDIKVLSSDAGSIVVEFKPVYRDTATITIQGQKYVKVNFAGQIIDNLSMIGSPQLQVRKINIGVPSGTGNIIQIIDAEYSVMNGKYLPVPKLVKNSFSYVEKYAESAKYSIQQFHDIVSFGDYGLVRNFPVQTINLYPVQFNPVLNTIKFLKKAVFRITFSQTRTAHEVITDTRLKTVVINWDVAKNWGSINSVNLKKTAGSSLTSGSWYKFETPTEGIYKIDKTFLQNLGIDVSTLDPSTIQIFGNGGYSLPEDLSISNNTGLIENAIFVSSQSATIFGDAGYILFYGRQPEFWEYNFSDSLIERVKQPFTKTNYYWLTFGSAQGKRMDVKPSLSVQNFYEQNSTLAFASNDRDLVNLGHTGRIYLSDIFNSDVQSRTYLTSLNGIMPSSTIQYKIRTVNASTIPIPLIVQESGAEIYSNNIAQIYDTEYSIGTADSGNVFFKSNLTNEQSSLKISINTTSSGAAAYLDYFEIKYQKQLKAYSDYLLFFSKDTTAIIEYTLSNFSNSNIRVFDVTDFANVKSINNGQISGGQIKFQINESKNKVKKYIAIDTTTTGVYQTPANPVKVNLAGIRNNLSGSEMVIITAKVFQAQAERYADYRANQSPNKLSTSIYYVDDIMNEFGAGLLDPTAIRDFLKFAYDNWQTKPFYVLLFGDGDYDCLNVENKNLNFIPTYQTIESFDLLNSYPTDDYYARVSGNDFKVDLAIGRLDIQTNDDATSVVDKIIKYETDLSRDIWRNRIALAADDAFSGTSNDGDLHTSQSEDLANNHIPQHFELNKIYLAAYPTTYSGNGRLKPEVNKAIIDAMNGGTLIFNWIGHGNPEVWAHENVFVNTTSIPQLKNENYFFLTAATCDFGRYDDPDEQSGTELLINLKNAGAIGALSSARVVFSSDNAALNESFYTNLFGTRDPNNLPIRVGNAYFLMKQYMTSVNDQKFHLFGDPAIRLNEPHLVSSIDSVNNKSLQSSIQINALGEAKIVGFVRNADGSKNSFTGVADISVFDSDRKFYFPPSEDMPNLLITMPGGLLYRGKSNFSNGEFSTDFVVPKDISYENKNGKIISYVSNNSDDGIGYTTNIIVGGTNPNAVNDGKGPDISIYFDNINFADSYLVNSNFALIVKLTDQTGINTTGTGIGHKLEGILNDDVANAIDFTNYFTGDANSGGKSGTVQYPFTNMQPGDYKIKVQAWDVFNNLSTKEVTFKVVSQNNGIVISDIYNYPNPFSSRTTFTFQHNFSDPINVRIKIYTVAGRLIKQIEESNILERFVKIDWNGRDEDNNQIANGTYLYKLIVESSDGNFNNTALGKIAIIR